MTEPNVVQTDWPLTQRQLECLRGYWQRKNAKEIAIELGISPDTVELHLKKARRSLGTQTSLEAARMVFGGDEDVTVRPYYDPTGIAASDKSLHFEATPTAHNTLGGVVSEQVPINRFGTGATLAMILVVAVISITAVALLISAGQGLTELGVSLGY